MRRILKNRVRLTRVVIAALSVLSMALGIAALSVLSMALGIAALSVLSMALGIAARIVPRYGTSAASNRQAPAATHTFITGDRVMMSRMPDGKPAVSVVPDGGGSRNARCRA